MAEGKKLIYAADDEQDILDVMREFLQNGGFSVRTFSTGDALYEAFLKETDHMRGFLLGGDDYLIKPFSPSLLVVRIKALLRRVEMMQPVSVKRNFGDLAFDESKHTVLCGEVPLELTVTEFALLGCLMENAGNAVSRDTLLNRVWGIDSDEVETRVTDETVRRIRQKLKTASSSVKISAVWGYGYKLEVQHA